MLWSWLRWIKEGLFVYSLTDSPMPESGDVEVLAPSSITFPDHNLPDRRRIGLKLDFSRLGGSAGDRDDYHMPKKCKFESMSFATCSLTSALSLNKTSIPARTILPHELATKLTKAKPVLVLDCRPFLAFNLSHIHGAVNISCSDRFSKKRLQQGKISVSDLVTTKEGKDIINKKLPKEVVLYDEQTNDLRDITTDNALHYVLSSLHREGRETFVLKGGLKDFSTKHGDLCDSVVQCDYHRPLYSPTNHLTESAAEIEAAVASQVLPFLYLGNERDAASLDRLRSHRITHVLNVTSHVPLYYEKQGIKYKRIPASDSGQQNLKQYFEEALEFIDDCRQTGGHVLIHCHAGVSRSATITIAYILKHTKMTMTDAYKYVKGKRGIISPNFNFMGQLMEFERDLNLGETPRVLQPKLQGVESTV
ncbi:dual specificity protein phosphatase 10-like [Haliotis rubra]|uniref:dual specificity protein phosphatase 10-like n=1 Tax=Haliotis rubra TaxID=36100 RepID=UPI001EE5AA8D|nr:dual specificity protein phosphatase 10-like [Haliotis rubra]